jgi:hypothetical protein
MAPFATWSADDEAPTERRNAATVETGWRHVGFYLHGGWIFDYPFAPRKWQREDFRGMFRLLDRMGFDTVMYWPLLEAIPMPLSDADAEELRAFRLVVDDAHAAGLRFWFAGCPNLTTPPSLRAKPWRERNPYPVMRIVRFDDPVDAAAYFEHRAAMMKILNNADGYVTIDGDPGGYAGALPEHFVDIFVHDAATLAAHGEHPGKQEVIPWMWCGWGTKGVWKEPVEPFLRAVYEILPRKMPEPWSLLPGRMGHYTNRAAPVRLAEAYQMQSRSTLMFYGPVEYEPSPPAAKLQFNIIRRSLHEETMNRGLMRGVMGNAQQPVMVLPNIWFFVRCAKNPDYAAKNDTDVLHDFADFLGGERDTLARAWRCLSLGLADIPADLPARLRSLALGENAELIPGGPERYLDILARQVESQRRLLAAMTLSATTDMERAAALAEGIKAVVSWWEIHHFSGGGAIPFFQWTWVPEQQRDPFITWVRRTVPFASRKTVHIEARRMLADVLPGFALNKALNELFHEDNGRTD